MIAKELIKRKKFVYLCTNGILMKKKLDLFEPSPYFAWVVHLDGMREIYHYTDEDDEPINRGLLLKFLSSVRS